MYQRVVVGTDGSPTAQRVVQAAGDLALLTAASLHVVAAYKPARIAVLAGVGGAAARYGDDERLAAKLILDHAIESLPRELIPVTAICRLGDASDVLLAVAEEVNADLLVIGNRGAAGLCRYLLGGAAGRLPYQAPCSVHVVHTC
jgi:nucleotide-binding universal stress UspA family protein